VVACVLAVLAGCAPAQEPVARSAVGDDAITVASFDFPESVLLADLYASAMRGAGLKVDLRLDLGPRELVEPALQRGLVEFVPEYAGSALDFASLGGTPATHDASATHDALDAAMAPRGIVVLDAAPAESQNGIAVTAATAREHHLVTIGDLAPIANELSFGGPIECEQRPLCLPGLRSTYGLRFARFVPLDAGGPLTVAALESGQVDVALMFTTDGRIAADSLVLLKDDRRLQPAENVTPVVRRDALERFGPDLSESVDAVSAELTTRELRDMNAAVATGGAPAAVAAAWLRRHGIATG
jgi:osmoprotectant transport system substrate-binding protein